MTAEDKLAITELLYRYAELIDAGDFDGVGQLLARATFGGTGPQGVSGAAKIAKLFATTTRRYPEHENTPRTRHLVLNPIVEISTEISAARTAISRSTFCVVQNTETVPLQPIVVGRYFDSLHPRRRRLALHGAQGRHPDDRGRVRPPDDRSDGLRRIGSGATLSASTLVYRVLGGRRPTPAPAPATTARGHGRMPNTW